MAVDSVS
jgi:hypothetical protein